MRYMLVVSSLVVGLAHPVGAQICDRAMALRVNERGLGFLAREAVPFLPKELTLPAISKTLVDWPLTEEDAVVEVGELKAAFTIKDLQVVMDEGALNLLIQADVSTGAPVKILNPYVGHGEANCQADVQIKDLRLRLGVQLESDAGRTRVEVTSARVDLDNDQSKIALEGCTIGDILTAVVTFLRKHFMGTIQNKVEALGKEKIPPLLEERLNQNLGKSGQASGLLYSVELAGLATDNTGLSASLTAAVKAEGDKAPACLGGVALPPAASCVGPRPALRPDLDVMFGAGVSAPLLQQALQAIWQSGKLCLDSRSLNQPLLKEGLSKMSSALGQPPGTELAFSLRLASPPALRLTAAGGMALALRGLHLELALQAPGGDPGRVAVSADLSLSAAPWIDPATSSVALDLRALAVERLQILGQQGSTLPLDPARLQRFVAEVGLPVIQQKLTTLQLSPAVISVLGLVYVELKQIDVGEGYLAAYLDAYSTLSQQVDEAPPDTLLQGRPGPLVGPQIVPILVSGTDDVTPVGLLRFKARVDGGGWSKLSYSRRLDVAVSGGLHTIEIVAVDLQDKEDPSPLRLQIAVDDVPPELKLHARPETMVSAESVAVSFSGSDDRTPPEKLTYQLELYRVPDGGGMPELRELRPYQPGIANARFAGLESGVYRIRIIARDEAGNVTSADAGFTVDLPAGCALAGEPGAAPSGVLLAALLLLLAALPRRRWRP